MEKQFEFRTDEISSQIKNFRKNGITEFSLHDDFFAENKANLLDFLNAVRKYSPELFVSVKINPRILDSELCASLSKVNCSVEMDFSLSEKGFDKKLFQKKCALLNSFGLVFGVNLYFAALPSDSLKSFKERLDFTVAQYPNHIDFPSLESDEEYLLPKVSGTFSAMDIRFARNIAFACRTFYSAGRAVSWFNSVLSALKIQSSAFFADFAEWQKVNNCDWKSGYVPENEKHSELEKMQILFLDMKIEEKKKPQLLSVVNDIVKINGALSRLVAEGEESSVELDYSPDDLLSPESLDLVSFSNDVCMEHCTAKIFLNSEGEPDYSVEN